MIQALWEICNHRIVQVMGTRDLLHLWSEGNHLHTSDNPWSRTSGNSASRRNLQATEFAKCSGSYLESFPGNMGRQCIHSSLRWWCSKLRLDQQDIQIRFFPTSFEYAVRQALYLFWNSQGAVYIPPAKFVVPRWLRRQAIRWPQPSQLSAQIETRRTGHCMCSAMYHLYIFLTRAIPAFNHE